MLLLDRGVELREELGWVVRVVGLFEDLVGVEGW